MIFAQFVYPRLHETSQGAVQQGRQILSGPGDKAIASRCRQICSCAGVQQFAGGFPHSNNLVALNRNQSGFLRQQQTLLSGMNGQLVADPQKGTRIGLPAISTSSWLQSNW